MWPFTTPEPKIEGHQTQELVVFLAPNDQPDNILCEYIEESDKFLYFMIGDEIQRAIPVNIVNYIRKRPQAQS